MPMNYSRFFSIFITATLLTYGAIGFYLMQLATFQGDLTRMSLLPERLFGWTKPQPAIATEWLQQSSMREADVLVIGDSFSDPRIWQTVLTQNGFKVRTEYLSSFDNKICADIESWLRAQGFSGKHLVIESVERNMTHILSESTTCQQTQYHPAKTTDAVVSAPPVSLDVDKYNFLGKMSIGYKSLYTTMKYHYLRGSEHFTDWKPSKDVNVVPVKNGCTLFSHANCEDALFLTWDNLQEPTESTINNIQKLDSLFNNITPIWVFVPNKTTAYLHPEKIFWNQIEHQVRAPNLLKMTNEAIQAKTVDLYFGNNTHFSTTGYLLMGNEVLQSIQQKSLH